MTTAIIPARKGSRRIPNKNLADVCGRPLLWYTMDFARKAIDAGLIQQVILTTDYSMEELYQAGVFSEQRFCRVVERPEHLLPGKPKETPMQPVVDHAIEAAGVPEGEVCVLLQPTSPFRRIEALSACITRISGVFRSSRTVGYAKNAMGDGLVGYEDGNIYCWKAGSTIRESIGSLVGQIMPHTLQVDEPDDMEVVRAVMAWKDFRGIEQKIIHGDPSAEPPRGLINAKG